MMRVLSAITCTAAMLLASCTTPAPPRPAMQPLSVAGNFGFSEKDIDSDTIEVTYRGAAIQVSAREPRGDSRVIAEKEKVHDLALLRAAQIAQGRGVKAMRVVSEKTDSDVDVQSYPRCRPAPFWGYPGYGYGYGYGYRRGYYGWPNDYICSENRSAKGKAVSVLTVDLVPHPTSTDKVLLVDETVSRLQKTYANSTYQ
jgi:hypothetical protein